jgi:hypothetical protein
MHNPWISHENDSIFHVWNIDISCSRKAYEIFLGQQYATPIFMAIAWAIAWHFHGHCMAMAWRFHGHGIIGDEIWILAFRIADMGILSKISTAGLLHLIMVSLHLGQDLLRGFN